MPPDTNFGAPVFLEPKDARKIQEKQIARYGGGPAGVRSLELLESAVYAPRATFGGEFLYEFPFEMAAVYMIHIIKNHPMVNANKRTGSVSAMKFLELNGYGFSIPTPQLRELALRAEAGAEKADIAEPSTLPRKGVEKKAGRLSPPRQILFGLCA